MMVCAVVSVHAQQLTILDKSSREPVGNAAVYSKGGSPVLTNTKGVADISSMSSADSLYIKHPAYGLHVYAMEEIKSKDYKLLIAYRYVMIGEVIVAADKSEHAKEDVAYSAEIISKRQVEALNPQTSGDMLMNTGNVFVQKSQMGGSSPVLRGFEANKVLIVVDGVRMNNAIYRAGHLQNVITLDPNMLDRTEVIFGPSSVIYGSDALGGVMHFYTRKPVVRSDEKTEVSGNAFVRTSHASNEKTGHVDFNIGLKKLAFLTSVTFSDFGDLRAGNLRNPYDTAFGKRYFYVTQVNGVDTMMRNEDWNVQKYTGYSQMDLNEKILFRQGDKIIHLLNLQYSNSSNVPRYDRLTDMSGGNLRFAEWNYGPQKRLFGSYTLSLNTPEGKAFSHGTVILAWQDIDEERITRRFKNNNRTSQFEEVSVISVNADFLKKIGEKQQLNYGLEAVTNDVQSKAMTTDITTGTVTDAAERYPDGGSKMNSGAVYVAHQIKFSDKVILSEGLRYSLVTLESNWVDTAFFPFPFTSAKMNNGAVSGNVALVLMPCKGWRFNLLASTGFRAPNVDDMGKFFDSSPGNVVVPNPGLKPEYAWNGEIGVTKTINEMARMEVSYFYTVLTNAIVIKDFTFNGSDSVLYDGSMSRVQAAQNVNTAWIQGIAGAFTADFNEHFSMRSTVNWTYGRYEDLDNDTIVPMDHIPPMFGRTGLVYKTKNFEMEGYTLYNGWKRLKDYSPSGEDNQQYATVAGTPAWYTLNARAAYQFGKFVRLSVALENITDLHYRHFASGVSSPGRNLVVSLRTKF
ncbi:MAG: iron complex outermembrane recepter protein [Bacteroidetes bacterium]|nr:MAG: iron complex outermembrane recepter protein [Bacteroidota bacterium]